jgi:FtsP/CotA-like multicopper oxidase with cupredoxin domain
MGRRLTVIFVVLPALAGLRAMDADSPQATPPIAPGGSFLARMTPPRAGTVIYHTHWHDTAQLTSGLYGPMFVIEPGQKVDPEVHKIFVLSRQGSERISFCS